MCPKDFVSNRNINDIFEEAPLISIGICRANGERKYEPVGRHNHSPAWSRNAAERWVWNKK